MKVYSFPARSTMKVAQDMMVKLQHYGLPDGYMGVWNPNVMMRSRYKWVYYVVEWVLSDNEVTQVNNFPKPIIPASNWVKFLSRNYKYPAVKHEVSHEFTRSPVRDSPEKFDFISITYNLVRKTPAVLLKYINYYNKKYKGVVIADLSVCNQIKNPLVKCVGFGSMDETTLKNLMYNSSVMLNLTGLEGFGLPALEMTYLSKPVISNPIPPYLEFHNVDMYTIPFRFVKMYPLYQSGTLHPTVLPRPEYQEEYFKFIDDMIQKAKDGERDNALDASVNFVRKNLIGGREYKKIVTILANEGLISEKVLKVIG
jgi:hypothetical protein